MKKMLSTIVMTMLMVFSVSACGGGATPEHEHVWDAGTVTTEATCHSEGLKTFKCTVEGCQQTKTENIATTPHNWNAGTVTKPATCSETGVKTFNCQNEGCTESKTVVIEKLEHNFVVTGLSKIPDLYTDGEEELTCSLCGGKSHELVGARAHYTESFGRTNWQYCYLDSFNPEQTEIIFKDLSKDGNAYKNENITLTKEGLTVNGVAAIGYKIDRDVFDFKVDTNSMFVGEEETTRLEGHLVVVDKENKVKEITKISNDGNIWSFVSEEPSTLSKGDIIAVILENKGTTAAKGSFELTFKAECIHAWGDGEVTKAATCKEEGVRTYKCAICQHTHVEAIPKTDHTWNDGEITTQPTETSTGVKTFTCTVCGETKEETLAKLPHEIANFHDSFSTSENNGWLYGYATDYNWDNDNFTFNALNKMNEEAWGGVPGLEIKKDWVLTEAEGKDLAVGYALPDGNTDLEVQVAFTAVEAAEGKTRLHARVLVVGSNNQTKSCVFVGDGQEKASWSTQVKLTTENGDKVYVILFNTETAGWRQGKLQVSIKGQEGTPFVPSEPPEIPEHDAEGHINLTNKIENRFDDEIKDEHGDVTGHLDIACTSTLVNNGYGAQLDVTKACTEVWRLGMFINTGVALEAGKTYVVTFHVERTAVTDYEVILQNKQWNEQRIEFLNKDIAYGDVHVEPTIDATTTGTLWILVQAGNGVNKITISNIKVEEKHVHTWDAGVVTTEPTEHAAGVKTYTCQNDGCDHTKQESVDKLLHKVADFYNDFSTNGGNGWEYGYVDEISDLSDDHFTFNFTSLTKQTEQEWGGVSGLIIKNDWVLNEADGKNLAVGYVVPEGNTKLGLNITFDGTENGVTKQHCRVIVADSTGNTKSVHFIGEGQEAADWNKYLEVSVANGDKVYVTLFNTGEAGWRQGKLQVVVSGYGAFNLTNKIENRFDDEIKDEHGDVTGHLDIACTSTLANGGYGAQLDVTKITGNDGDKWREGMFINTGVTLQAGYDYYISLDVTETGYNLIFLNDKYGSKFEDEGQCKYGYDGDGHVEVVIHVTNENVGEGKLFILIESGDAVRTVQLTNLIIERVVRP